jgi:predicted NAD/FAD-binding protein
MNKKNKKIAIIGSGISGLLSGYILSQEYNIDIYEKSSNIGGNVLRKSIKVNDENLNIDFGVHSFNTQNSTNLSRILKYFDISTDKINSSLSISYESPYFEYILSNLNSSIKPSFFDFAMKKFVKEMKLFSQSARDNASSSIKFGLFLEQLQVSKKLKEYFIDALTTCSSIGHYNLLDAPISKVMFLLKNMGLMYDGNHYQFRIRGGASELISKLSKNERINIYTNCKIKYIKRLQDEVLIENRDKSYCYYDDIIFSCNPEEILKLVEDLDKKEEKIFKNFYQEDLVSVLHTSTDYMPIDKKKWRIYNYKGNVSFSHHANLSSFTRCLNKEYSINTKYPIFISFNTSKIPEYYLSKHIFKYPTFVDGASNIDKLSKLQGINHSYYCGAYLENGTFECAIKSAINVCSLFSITPQWKN